MSVSAAEASSGAPSLPAEVSPGLDASNDTTSESATLAPRRGARTRRPTSKAAGVDAAQAADVQAGTQARQASTRSIKKRKADELIADTASTDASAADPEAINNEVAEVFEGASGHASDADDDDDGKQYCICRGKDDGTFMISCERCQEWYHTKCIGITQKAAKKLEEYVCDSCSSAAQQKASSAAGKPAKRYKSSARKKAAASQEPQDDEAESDDAQNDDDASDGDEYIGEQGEDASDAEDAPMEDVSSSTQPARTRRPLKSDSTAAATAEVPLEAKGNSSSSNADAKRKSTQDTRRPSGASRTVSGTGTKKGGPRRPIGPTDASTEEARSRARKVLASALEKIFASHGSETASEEAEESDAERGEAFAALLERELFDANADAHGSIRVVGSKYKDRFRTFLFSLKDAKNTTLHSRIASGDLQPSELAKMSNEELANDAIRQATEKARLEALHRSTLRAETSGPMRKITHKGEVEIESDALLARDQPGKFQTTVESRPVDAAPAPRISESEPALPTQDASSPESNLGDDREGKVGDETDRMSPPHHPTRNSAPAPSLAQGSPSRLNFGDVWAQSADSKTQDDDINPESTESFGFDVGSPHDEPYEANADMEAAATSGADDFIDSFLDGNDGHDAESGAASNNAKSEAAAERSTTPDAEPSGQALHRFRPVIWNGLMDLPDVYAFKGHIKQVAGRSIAHAPRVCAKFLPDRALLIAGRLPTKAAVDYLLQVANAPRTEILAFCMEPGAHKDGLTQVNDSDLASFGGMLKHFQDADRWGALHVSSSVKGSLIKDFYLVPLRKDEEVPLWLDMAESDCLGADWHTKRDRDLLILVAVVIRDSLQAELSKAERAAVGRHRSVTNDREAQQQDQKSHAAPAPGVDEAYDPAAGISVPLGGSVAPAAAAPTAPSGFGSDALQSLLRTLGKTAAPAPTDPAGGVSTGAAGATPPGPPPPGPPPGPPPAFISGGAPAPGTGSPLTGSWSPHPPPGGGADAAAAPWQPSQGYGPPGYDIGGASVSAPYGPHSEWEQGPGWNYGPGAGMPPPSEAPPAPQQPVQVPEEEYPGQYNPDYLAQASAGAARGGAGFGPRGGFGYGHGHGHGFAHGRGRGGWRGRGW